jgi:hypothetical protein
VVSVGKQNGYRVRPSWVFTMTPDAPEPARGTPDVVAGVVNAPAPGLILSIFSILIGIGSFSVPGLGIGTGCVGLWLGWKALGKGRSATYSPTVYCSYAGMALSGVAILMWVGVIVMLLIEPIQH